MCIMAIQWFDQHPNPIGSVCALAIWNGLKLAVLLCMGVVGGLAAFLLHPVACATAPLAWWQERLLSVGVIGLFWCVLGKRWMNMPP